VAEVAYGHFCAGPFRHRSECLRWRTDNVPRHYTCVRVARHGGAELKLLALNAGRFIVSKVR
jgi:hypothetical protein